MVAHNAAGAGRRKADGAEHRFCAVIKYRNHYGSHYADGAPGSAGSKSYRSADYEYNGGQEQLKAAGVDRPTHIFVQAGVGSLAGAVQGFFANLYPDNCPTTVIVEASEAACLYKSAAGEDGKIRFVDGDMQTIMAGLACGEPNTISWEILRKNSTAFVSCPAGSNTSPITLPAISSQISTFVILAMLKHLICFIKP